MSDTETDPYVAGYNAFTREAYARNGGTGQEDVEAYASKAGAAGGAAACAAMGAPALSPICAKIGAEIGEWIAKKIYPAMSAAFQAGIGADTLINSSLLVWNELVGRYGESGALQRVRQFNALIPERRAWENRVYQPFREAYGFYNSALIQPPNQSPVTGMLKLYPGEYPWEKGRNRFGYEWEFSGFGRGPGALLNFSELWLALNAASTVPDTTTSSDAVTSDSSEAVTSDKPPKSGSGVFAVVMMSGAGWLLWRIVKGLKR